MSKYTFLQEFGHALIDKHGIENLKDVSIVIPSQRVALHIRETLLGLASESFWMPRILPVNQFQVIHKYI